MMIARFGMAVACGAVVAIAGSTALAQAGANGPQTQYPQYQAQPQQNPSSPQYQAQPSQRQPLGPVQGPYPGPNQNPRPQYTEPQPPPPPFVLTPQEQADLDKALDEWERQSSQVNKFQGKFTHWKYDPTFLPPQLGPKGELVEQPIKYSTGEIKYAAPDKGLIEEVESQEVTNPGTPGQKVVKHGYGEHWACDGKILSALDHEKKEVHRTPLPPEMQGKFISEGPLPFAFGTKAAPLKARYYLRLITPPGETKSVWLDIRPRFQKDLTNFIEVDVILRAKDMVPTAIQITHAEVKVPMATAQGQKIVAARQRDVYQFDETSWILELPNLFGTDFLPHPLGWKIINEPTTSSPVAPPANDSQARRQWPTSGATKPY